MEKYNNLLLDRLEFFASGERSNSGGRYADLKIYYNFHDKLALPILLEKTSKIRIGNEIFKLIGFHKTRGLEGYLILLRLVSLEPPKIYIDRLKNHGKRVRHHRKAGVSKEFLTMKEIQGDEVELDLPAHRVKGYEK